MNPLTQILVAVGLGLCAIPMDVAGRSFSVSRIDDGTTRARDPVISQTGLAAWSVFYQDERETRSEIVVYANGERTVVSPHHDGRATMNVKPAVSGDQVAWTSFVSGPRAGGAARLRIDGNSGLHIPGEQMQGVLDVEPVAMEVVYWTPGNSLTRIPVDSRNELALAIGPDSFLAWQRAIERPRGWEIMVWKDGGRSLVTTNRTHDMAPRIHGSLVTWYGWDGEDYEIYLYDHASKAVEQVTSNRYDDVSPAIWGDSLAWVAYPAIAPDVYAWSRRDNVVRKLSAGVEDDTHPRIWKDYVVWQGFDGDDFEIFVYDLGRENWVKLTRNGYDDVQPVIRDGVIAWMGYHENLDSEIFLLDLTGDLEDAQPYQLTENEFEDLDPRTSGGRVIWQADEIDVAPIYLAVPEP